MLSAVSTLDEDVRCRCVSEMTAQITSILVRRGLTYSSSSSCSTESRYIKIWNASPEPVLVRVSTHPISGFAHGAKKVPDMHVCDEPSLRRVCRVLSELTTDNEKMRVHMRKLKKENGL